MSDHGGKAGSDNADHPAIDSVDHQQQYSAAEKIAAWHQARGIDAHERKPRRGRRARNGSRWRWWVELPILVVVAFVLTLVMQTFIGRVYYVPSGSMEPTLHGTTTGGDRILAYKLGYFFHDPAQGDVVVFRGPSTWVPEAAFSPHTSWLGKVGNVLGSVVGVAPPNEKDFVKRVIATGGQTVSCCDEAGRVEVDGVGLNEPYIQFNSARADWQWVPGESSCDIDPDDQMRYLSFRCFGPYTVPDDMVWVLGDNRSDSADSSYHCRGLVPAENVTCQGPVPVSDVIGKAVAIVMPPSRWGGISSPDLMGAGN